MNKKALIGKILLGIALIIVIIIGIIAVSAYQVYGFVNVIKTESPLIQKDIEALAGGNCSKITDIEIRVDRIQTKAETACGNPIIRKGIEKVEDMPFNCDELESMEEEMLNGFEQVKELCDNGLINTTQVNVE